MILEISLNVNDIKIAIKDGRKIVAEMSWTGEYTLNEKLLPNIDALLKKNKLDASMVTQAKAKISKDSGVTSTRIVQTLVKSWNAAAALKV